MAETLTVALRVAEEAIEEAIAKADEFSDSLVRHPSVPLLPLSLSLSLSVSIFSISSSFPFFSIPVSSATTSYLSSLLLPPSWSQYQRDAVKVFG